MLLLVVLASASAPVPQPKAQASVRIVRSIEVREREWKRLSRSRRREIVVNERGRLQTIRLIEFE
jgi:hypothetical protein